MASRGGAAVARWAHNPKAGSSNLPPATGAAASGPRFVLLESYWHDTPFSRIQILMPYKDPERRRAYGRDWMKRNPEKAREAMRRWRERHPNQHQLARDAYDAAHPQSAAARRTRYRLAHPEIRRVIAQRRRSRMAGTAGTFTLREWLQIKRFYLDRCAYCGSSGDLEDHVIPLARGGTNHISNIVPACGSCNRAKHLASASEFIAKLRQSGRRVRPALRASPCSKHEKQQNNDQREGEQA
jgi:5-methylcytosine-specific restriction endonuclease McrA